MDHFTAVVVVHSQSGVKSSISIPSRFIAYTISSRSSRWIASGESHWTQLATLVVQIWIEAQLNLIALQTVQCSRYATRRQLNSVSTGKLNHLGPWIVLQGFDAVHLSYSISSTLKTFGQCKNLLLNALENTWNGAMIVAGIIVPYSIFPALNRGVKDTPHRVSIKDLAWKRRKAVRRLNSISRGQHGKLFCNYETCVESERISATRLIPIGDFNLELIRRCPKSFSILKD